MIFVILYFYNKLEEDFRKGLSQGGVYIILYTIREKNVEIMDNIRGDTLKGGREKVMSRANICKEKTTIVKTTLKSFVT